MEMFARAVLNIKSSLMLIYHCTKGSFISQNPFCSEQSKTGFIIYFHWKEIKIQFGFKLSNVNSWFTVKGKHLYWIVVSLQLRLVIFFRYNNRQLKTRNVHTLIQKFNNKHLIQTRLPWMPERQKNVITCSICIFINYMELPVSFLWSDLWFSNT